MSKSFALRPTSRLALLLIVLFCSAIVLPHKASATPWQMIFPILGGGSYSNSFGAPRYNGPHTAVDIFAPKHRPVVSPVDGVIYYVMYPQPRWGYSVGIRDDDGFEYNFIHMNNDTPGTDDGAGGGMNAYAYDVKVGNRVVRGQHIGWVGDSGNAEDTPPHIHFEIYDPSGNLMNPYDYLRSAQIITSAVQHPELAGETLPYGQSVKSSPEMAYGKFTNDDERQLIVSPSAGSSPHVKVFNKTGDLISSFMAYDNGFTGGTTVAAGDVDGDGLDEIITGTGGGNSSHVKILKINGEEVANFFAYPGYNTGAIVAAGDVDGDGRAEIITGTGPGNSTHLKLFKFNGSQIGDFFVYPGSNIGIDISVADVTGDNTPEIITSPGPGGGANIKVLEPDGTLLSSFMAYDNFYGGTRVTTADIVKSSAKAEIIISPWFNGGPDIRVFSYDGRLIRNQSIYEVWWVGQYDIASDGRLVTVGTGGARRSSFRHLSFR